MMMMTGNRTKMYQKPLDFHREYSCNCDRGMMNLEFGVLCFSNLNFLRQLKSRKISYIYSCFSYHFD